MPLADAVAALTSGVQPVTSRRVPTSLAVGSVAAETIAADAPMPTARVAVRNGWAVAFADVSGATPHGPVPLGGRFGWVEAGDPLPSGFDTVLPPEAVEDGGAIADEAAGEGVRAAGGDLGAGDVLLRAGERLRPLHLVGLAAAGIADIAVRSPSVRLIIAGRGPGGRDALGPAIAAILRGWGCGVSISTPVDHTLDALAAALAIVEADAVLVIGGTGFGRTDHAVDALARAGMVGQSGIALRPGESAGFGSVTRRPVLLLPGRPDAALAALLTLGRPLVEALAGLVSRPGSPPEPTSRKIVSAIGLAEIVYVSRTASGLEPLGGAELTLRRLLRADGAVLVPPEREGYPEGMPLEMIPL